MYIDQCRLWILIDTVPGVTTVTHKNEYGSQFLCSVGDLGSVVHLDLGCTGRKGWLDMESSWPLAPAVDWESVSSWFWVWYWQSLSLFQGILSPVILEYGCRSLGSVLYWQTVLISGLLLLRDTGTWVSVLSWFRRCLVLADTGMQGPFPNRAPSFIMNLSVEASIPAK